MIPLPELIPARMLNEFAYCPRLAYLEWVQGEWAHNADTLEGRFGHRRADRPDDRPVPEPEAADEGAVQLHARTLLLSDPAAGLVARMDLLELDGDTVTPVDYKRGSAPDVPGRCYEPERVQLGAQALILRAAGYRCESGVLYFIASKTRVEVPIDEALVSRTLELAAELRRVAGGDRIPPPLEDSPKCPRCSLVGICLPDETRWLAAAAADESDAGAEAVEDRPVRRLLPARDDALPVYVQLQGAQVGKSGDRLSIKLKGELLEEVKLHDVSQLCLFGNAQVTTQAIQELASRGLPVCYFTTSGWFHALTVGLSHKNVGLRVAQYAAAADPARSLPFARAFVEGKVRNCRTMLRRHLESDPEGLVDRLSDLAGRASRAESAESLLGVEGTAARLYFSGFARLLNGGEEFRFDDRNRRPPRDPINATLSFLYSLLAKEMTVTLQSVGFDPMLGLFHVPKYGRPALALDLAEEFRPLVADSVALSLVNTGELSAGDFVRRAGACSLTERGRKAVLGAYERRLDQLVTHPVFGYRITYRRVFEVQARLLGRALGGELAFYPNFLTR